MKGVEPALPEHAVLLEPVVHLDQRLRTEAVDPALRVLAYVDQPGLPQHPQVPGHARTGDRECLGQHPRAGRMVAQDLQDRAPALVRQRVQHGIHVLQRNASVTYPQGYILTAEVAAQLDARVSVTSRPPVGLVPRPIEPPWLCTTASTMARPRPVPPLSARSASPRANRCTSRSRSSGAMPGPSSATHQRTRPADVEESGPGPASGSMVTSMRPPRPTWRSAFWTRLLNARSSARGSPFTTASPERV